MAKNKLEQLAEERQRLINRKKLGFEDNLGTRDNIILNLSIDKATSLLLIARALDFGYGKGSHDKIVGGDSTTVDDLFDEFMEMPHEL